MRHLADKDFSPIILRLATLFGMSSRMRFDLVINMFLGMALTTQKIILNSDGSTWRPFVHILDVCNAFLSAIDFNYNENKPLILNVGDTQNNFKIIDLAKMVTNSVKNCQIQFLQENPNLDKMQLIKDQNIQDGVDVRTYKISFEKIKRIFTNFSCNWDVSKGIENMRQKLDDISFSSSQFNNIDFYRLKKMEHLYNLQKISENLRWTVNI